MLKRFFICVSDIERLYGSTRSKSWCQRHYNHIKQVNNLSRWQTPTIAMYCEFEGISVEEFWAHLGGVNGGQAGGTGVQLPMAFAQ